MTDIIVVGLILLIAVIGFVRGFAATLLTLVSGVFSFVVVLLLRRPVATFLLQSGWLDGFHRHVAERLTNAFGAGPQAGAQALGLPDVLSALIVRDGGAPTAERLAGTATTFLANALAVVGLFVVLTVVVRLIIKPVVRALMRWPLFGCVNRVLGFVFGLLLALVIAYVVSLVLTALAPSVAWCRDVMAHSSVLRGFQTTRLFIALYDTLSHALAWTASPSETTPSWGSSSWPSLTVEATRP